MADKINMQTVLDEFDRSQEFRGGFSKDFKNIDNLVDGIPITKEDGTPFVGDTTIPGLVRALPRDSLQQMPVLSVSINGTKRSLYAILSKYFLRTKIFNDNEFGMGVLSTLQVGAEQAFSHGYAPFLISTASEFGEFVIKIKLMDYQDESPEPGIQQGNESGYNYVQSMKPKSWVKKTLEKAKKNPNTTWNVEMLERLLAMEPEGTNYNQSDARETAVKGNAYQIVTRYENGVGSDFITFAPQLTGSAQPLRVMDSRSKFGYPRVLYLVIDPAPLSPFGVSRVRLASPNANLNNAYYQNTMRTLIMNSDPPVLQRGRFVTPVVFKRRAKWVTQDPNATAELVTMDNGNLNQFVSMTKQLSSQIQNIMGGAAGNSTGDANVFGYSKTAPGVKAQREDKTASSSQVTNILEHFLCLCGLVGLDTYISEQSGEDDINVDDEAKDEINRLFPDTVGDDNMITIDWDKFYEAIKKWHVEVELSVSKDDLEEKARGDMQDTLTVLGQNADKIPGAAQKTAEIADRLLEKTIPESKRLPEDPNATSSTIMTNPADMAAQGTMPQ